MAREEPRWHPIMAAHEGPVGTWRLRDPSGREYGIVRLVRLAGEPKYRAEHDGEHLGYGGTLRSACERIHDEYIRAHGPSGGNAGRYPIHTPNVPRTALPSRG